MCELLKDKSLIFLGGLICGSSLTFLWRRIISYALTKKLRIKEVVNGNVEYEYADHSSVERKLILAVRNDLKMGKGKVAAQCSHAAVMAHESARTKTPNEFNYWKKQGQPKVVVKIDSEDEMMSLAKHAKECQLLVNIVRDAGRTQVSSGTKTVIAIGPGLKSLIDEVTGHLKLY